MASQLCRFKQCNRPVSLLPAEVVVEKIGTVSVQFGQEPSEAVEAFSAAALAAGHLLLPQSTVDALMQRFCGTTGLDGMIYHRGFPLEPVVLPIDLGARWRGDRGGRGRRRRRQRHGSYPRESEEKEKGKGKERGKGKR